MVERRVRHLSSKFLLITVPVIVVCAVMFFAGLVWFKLAEAERVNLQLARKIASRDAALLSSPIWNVDVGTARAILGSLRDDPRVRCIRLLEMSGIDGSLETGECDGALPLTELSTPVVFSDNDDVRTIARLQHRVDVSVPFSSLWSDLLPLVWLLLIMVGALIFCALLAFRFTVRAPLDRASASVRRYRRSGERQLVEWDSNDELGEFIREYNAGLQRQEQAEQSLQEQLSFQRALRDTMPTPFAFLDLNWQVFDANPAFYLQLGFDPAESMGPLSERFDDIDWESIRQLVPGAIYRGELLGLEVDGDDRGFQFMVSPFLDANGKQRGYVTVWQDITSRIVSEHALRGAKARAEIALLDLQRAQRSLVQSEKLASLGSLVAGIAHEINTPVGSSLTVATHMAARVEQVRGEFDAGALKKSVLAEFLASASEAFSILTRALHNAAELISKFKQVAVDQTSSQRRPFDLGLTVDEVIATLRPAMKHSPHSVRLQIPRGIVLDSYPGPLGQVVSNCFNNAMMHAFEGIAAGQVEISAEELDDQRIRLIIADNGRGIPPEHIDRVFDPFFTTRLGSGGSGLGMHLVYGIVTGLLGGSITLDSEPGRGTRVIIELPRVAPHDRRESWPRLAETEVE